ncbi:MAG: hypothetical protein ACRDDZ_05885 [Marinifilaceae bacterium]
MFKKVLAAVTAVLGVESLPKKDGVYQLSTEQLATLTGKYGATFVEQFKKELAEVKADDVKEDVAETKAALVKLQAEYDAFKSSAEEKEKNLNALVETLSADAEDDLKAAASGSNIPAKEPAFKLASHFLHNKVIENSFSGDGTMKYLAETITTTELRAEFGQYVKQMDRNIITMLTGQLTCTKHMRTIMADETEWRASKAIISDLIQKFTPVWTPSGKTTFTPIVIKNRKHKVNLAITPAEIMTDVIGYLYDEGLQPKDMPIVKYIINVMMQPKIQEERESLLAVGVYDENKNKDKTAGQEGDVGGTMDGYVTILRELHAKTDTHITKLLEGVTLTDENIYEKFGDLYLQVPKNYRTKKLPIHIDPDLLYKYKRARNNKFLESKTEGENVMTLPYTNFFFVPMDGMIGTGCMFLTPKENFIRLVSKNKGSSKIFIQEQDYDVKVFAEWWEAPGFAVEELLFGYVPPVVAVVGSGDGQTA